MNACVRGLEALGIALGIEQRRRRAMQSQGLPEPAEPGGIQSERDGEFLVLRQGGGDEFGQTDRREQARGHPPGERRSGTGEDR